MSDERARKLAQLRQAYEQGLLDEDTYQTVVAALDRPVDLEAKVEGSGSVAQVGGTATGERGVAAGRDIRDSVVQTGEHSTYLGSVDTLRIESAIFLAPRQPGEVDPKHLLWTYLNKMVSDTATLDLSGIDRKTLSERDEARLELASVYTALDTVRSVSHLESTESKRHGLEEETLTFIREDARQSALAFVNETKYAALLGDPGSGKTTFANFLALCLAGELLGLEDASLERLGEEWQIGALLPMRVMLRHFAARLPVDDQNPLWAYMASRMGETLAAFAPLLQCHLLEKGGLLILDGLDEVPEAARRRQQVKQAVLAFKHDYPKVRILLSSRTYAYQRQAWRLPQFTDAVLAPFSPEQIDAFVDSWYDHMAQVRANLTLEEAKGRASLLKQAINRTSHLKDLAPRPLLLTLMASLHAWRGGSLPEQREELYEESVNLLLDFWERPKAVLDREGQPILQTESASEWFNTSRERIQEELEHLTFAAHRDQEDLVGTADIEEATLVAAMLRASGDPDLRAGRVLEYIRDRAGLLTNRGEGIYSFPHRTFQEYLAARYLTRASFPKQLVQLVRDDAERWREVCLLAGAKVARGTPFAAWSLVQRLCPHACDDTEVVGATETDWWAVLLAGRLLIDTGIYQSSDLDDVEAETLSHVRQWLAALLQQGRLPPVDRASAGVALGLLGDPRPGVGVVDDVPDILWSRLIEPGPFIMGTPKEDAPYDDEVPQFTCQLIEKPFMISLYAVTVEQYQAFTDDGGYRERDFWTETGWTWRERQSITEPRSYGAPFSIPNHPQVGVSWYEAMAYCHWLSQRLGRTVRLPSEAQWERAARHTDGRLYPWGEGAPATRCNMSDTGIGATCAVGMFPDGAAQCGAVDMSGNVWECCRTAWLENYDAYEENVTDEEVGSARRVLRGGSFGSTAQGVRCACRRTRAPDNWWLNLRGFRVVCAPS